LEPVPNTAHKISPEPVAETTSAVQRVGGAE